MQASEKVLDKSFLSPVHISPFSNSHEQNLDTIIIYNFSVLVFLTYLKVFFDYFCMGNTCTRFKKKKTGKRKKLVQGRLALLISDLSPLSRCPLFLLLSFLMLFSLVIFPEIVFYLNTIGNHDYIVMRGFFCFFF